MRLSEPLLQSEFFFVISIAWNFTLLQPKRKGFEWSDEVVVEVRRFHLNRSGSGAHFSDMKDLEKMPLTAGIRTPTQTPWLFDK